MDFMENVIDMDIIQLVTAWRVNGIYPLLVKIQFHLSFQINWDLNKITNSIFTFGWIMVTPTWQWVKTKPEVVRSFTRA